MNVCREGPSVVVSSQSGLFNLFPGKKDPQKKKQLPGKQALEIDEDKDQQPKKIRGVGAKQKVSYYETLVYPV